MIRKVSFVGTALFGLVVSAALLSSCGQKTETPTSGEATSATPSAVSPVAGSSSTSDASPVADSSANTASPAASPAAESTDSNTTSTVAASPSPASADATASTSTPADSTTASTTTESPAATTDSTTASSTPEAGTPELISAAAFEEIDVNKAGKITVEDFVGYYTEKADSANKLSKEDAQKNFKQLDKDNDGSLTKEEATGQM